MSTAPLDPSLAITDACAKLESDRTNDPKERPPSVEPRLRQCSPGATYLVTRKTNDGLFWLVPDAVVNAILLYLVGLKAKRYKLQIHGFIAMANHIHFVLTDLYGNMPDFTREFFSESGKALKIHRRTDRKIWGSGRPGSVRLLDRDAAERFIAYTINNPEEAGLTRARDYSGLTSAKYAFGDTIVVERPGIYFSKRYRPERVELVLEPLPELFPEPLDPATDGEEPQVEVAPLHAEASEVSEDEWTQRCRDQQARVDALVTERSRALRRDRERRGRRLAGIARVLAMSVGARGPKPFGQLNPRFATRDRELMRRAIECERAFRRAHRKAKEKYIAGHTQVVFPSGTYGYRRLLGVRVARGGLAA